MWILSVKCHDITQIQELAHTSSVSCQFSFINYTTQMVLYVPTRNNHRENAASVAFYRALYRGT